MIHIYTKVVKYVNILISGVHLIDSKMFNEILGLSK